MTEPALLYADTEGFAAGSDRRILVASVSAGTGHVRAAEAILDAFRSTHPLARIVHLNVLDHARPGFRRIYEGGYSFLVNRAPRTWERVYRFTDRVGAASDPLLSRMQQRQAGGFLDYVRRYRPNRVIATHFLIAQLFQALPENERPPLDVVVTDFDVHNIWIHPLVSRYFVAGEAARQRMLAAGVAADRIVASGIPIHPVFLRPVDGELVRASLDLSNAVPTVLLLGGGQGWGALAKTVEALFSSPFRLQVLAVAGRNARLLESLKKLQPPDHVVLKPFGFVTNMHELMSAVDVVVTKPGGLTVAESLAKGAALVLHSAIPGQEERNADFVALHGAGVKVEKGGDVAQATFDCLGNLSRLNKFRERAEECGRPRAAFDVARLALTDAVQ